MMRVFIAIDCTPIKQELKHIQKCLHYPQKNFLKSFHLTLRFLGNIDEEEVNALQTNLRDITSPPFTLEFNHLGFFAHKSRQVIWLGVKDKKKITWLAREVGILIGKVQKKFIPHITLVRIQQRGAPHAVYKPIAPLKMKVSSFSLIESRTSPKGTRYIPIETYKLK